LIDERIRLKIIVNADDLGISVEVNSAISSLLEQEKITSSSIMSNAPYFEEAVNIAKKFPNYSFGIHLNLTKFKPLAEHQSFVKYNVVDVEGNFKNDFRNIKPNYELIKAFKTEWCQQIIRLIESGIRISHIDSHHHIHTIPWLFPVLKNVQKKFGIRCVRTTRNFYDQNKPSARLVFQKKVWHLFLRYINYTITTDYFTSFIDFYGNFNSFRSLKPEKTIELMCHPGNLDCREETNLLGLDWIFKVPFKVSLISYHDLISL